MNFECTVWKINIFSGSVNVQEQSLSLGVPHYGRVINSDAPIETCSRVNLSATSMSLHNVGLILTYVSCFDNLDQFENTKKEQAVEDYMWLLLQEGNKKQKLFGMQP